MSRVQEQDAVDLARAGGQYVEEQKRPRPAALPRAGRRRGIGAGALAIGARAALAQEDMGPVAPPSTVTTPPRDFGPDAPPNVYFWDADVIAVDPSFNGLAQPNAPIQRLWTGALWAEGPAWNASRPLSGLERHPEQPADALDRGRRSRVRLPHALEQQQRQHLRLSGPADLLRASRRGA